MRQDHREEKEGFLEAPRQAHLVSTGVNNRPYGANATRSSASFQQKKPSSRLLKAQITRSDSPETPTPENHFAKPAILVARRWQNHFRQQICTTQLRKVEPRTQIDLQSVKHSFPAPTEPQERPVSPVNSETRLPKTHLLHYQKRCSKPASCSQLAFFSFPDCGCSQIFRSHPTTQLFPATATTPEQQDFEQFRPPPVADIS
jgi:hypothetical protein